MDGYWGSHTYSAGDRVPLKTQRCVSTPLDARGHTCRQHHSHSTDHRCICGKSWPREVKS